MRVPGGVRSRGGVRAVSDSGRACGLLPQQARRFRRPSEREFTAEVEAHLAHETDEQIERGLPLDDARSAALRRFGNVTRHLERFREASPWFWLDTFCQHVRYGWRSVRGTPALFFAAVASLALSLGGTVVISSVLDASVIRRLL